MVRRGMLKVFRRCNPGITADSSSSYHGCARPGFGAGGGPGRNRDRSRLDITVNAAGMGIAGAVEDTSAEEAAEQMDTNFLGTLRVMRAVLPQMRSQGGRTDRVHVLSGRMGACAFPVDVQLLEVRCGGAGPGAQGGSRSRSGYALRLSSRGIRVRVSPAHVGLRRKHR